LDEFAAIVMAELPHDQRERVKDRLRLLAFTLDHSEWLGRIETGGAAI
jgi:hypothetical protein